MDTMVTMLRNVNAYNRVALWSQWLRNVNGYNRGELWSQWSQCYVM